jgi:hypothetical protein
VTWDDNFYDANSFQGNPSAALDRNWNALFHGYSLRVPREALERNNQTSIQLADEQGGYMSVLSVLHELHCLVSRQSPALYTGLITIKKTIRHWILRDYYPDDNFNEQPGRLIPLHVGQ